MRDPVQVRDLLYWVCIELTIETIYSLGWFLFYQCRIKLLNGNRELLSPQYTQYKVQPSTDFDFEISVRSTTFPYLCSSLVCTYVAQFQYLPFGAQCQLMMSTALKGFLCRLLHTCGAVPGQNNITQCSKWRCMEGGSRSTNFINKFRIWNESICIVKKIGGLRYEAIITSCKYRSSKATSPPYTLFLQGTLLV